MAQSPVLLHLTTYVGNSKSESLRPIKVGAGSQTSQSVFAFLLHVLLSTNDWDKNALLFPCLKRVLPSRTLALFPAELCRICHPRQAKVLQAPGSIFVLNYFETEHSTSRYSDQCFTKGTNCSAIITQITYCDCSNIVGKFPYEYG